MMTENVIYVSNYIRKFFSIKNAFFSLGPKIAYAKKLNTGKKFSIAGTPLVALIREIMSQSIKLCQKISF